MVVPSGSRRKMSDRRPSSSSMVKPWTIDQARAIAPACSSDSESAWRYVRAGWRRPRWQARQMRPRRLRAATAATCRAARCGTSARTCRDAPAHRRHRLWRWPAPSRQMRFAAAGGHHRRVEHAEADRGEFADKAGEVAEMMGRRGVRNARLARHRAQRQTRPVRRVRAPSRPPAARPRAGRHDDRAASPDCAAPPPRGSFGRRPLPACAASPLDGFALFSLGFLAMRILMPQCLRVF